MSSLKQSLLSLFAVLQLQVLICRFGRDTPLGSAVEETKLKEIRLDHIHDRILLLADRGSNRVQANRSTAILLDDGVEYPSIDIIQT